MPFEKLQLRFPWFCKEPQDKSYNSYLPLGFCLFLGVRLRSLYFLADLFILLRSMCMWGVPLFSIHIFYPQFFFSVGRMDSHLYSCLESFLLAFEGHGTPCLTALVSLPRSLQLTPEHRSSPLTGIWWEQLAGFPPRIVELQILGLEV